jgi:hypothetical protein
MATNEAINEWQECRTTTARFDEYLADTRKYGFTLVTVLLTANALVVDKNTAVDRPAASIVIMALLLALFMLDNYYWVLVRAAVDRSKNLEKNELKGFHTQLSTSIGQQVKLTHATDLILAVYVVFVLVAAGIGLTAGIASGTNSSSGTAVVVAVGVGELAAMGLIFLKVQPTAPPSKWFKEQVLRQKNEGAETTKPA